MEQNKNSNSNNFYALSYLGNVCLMLLGLLIAIIVALSIQQINVIWPFLITLPFPLLGVFLSKVFTNVVVNIGKNSKSKSTILAFSISLFISKWIIVLIPLIVGLVINLTVNNIFNIYALVAAALIYPLTTLIVQWYFVFRHKKSNINKDNNG